MNPTLNEAAWTCLCAADPDEKLSLTHRHAEAARAGALNRESGGEPMAIRPPGRPARPELVDPARVPLRKLGHPEGRAALIHAVAHIEFSAINLAWDAVYRFRGLPPEYYLDWTRVADEEARHFELLRGHLRSMGYDYGSFPAHNGLWEMAEKTAHDALVRMALVPRVLEARGLDVTPGMIRRLRHVGDGRAADIFEVIFRDEIGHVAIGTRWFSYLCAQRGLDRETTFERLVLEYVEGRGTRRVEREARMRAGFSERELQFIETGLGV
jgi:uncharacterized ferritin-like protein (DUF455 family)